MKSVVKVSAAIALAASTVSAQIDRFPECAYGCLSQLNLIAGCLNTDYRCFCDSNAFLAGFNPCIGRACDPADYQSVSDAAEGLCADAGVTVTVTADPPAATQSTPPELARFPGCARDCVSQLNAIAGCGETDFGCFCRSNAFLAGFNPCISLLCEPADYSDTSDAAEALCADNGVTVTVTATYTPPPQPTEAPTEEPSETEPAETTGAEETSEPAETSGPEETDGPAETSGPEETDGPVPTTVTTVPTGPGATTTVPPTGNRTSSGSGSTPTTNAAARHTAFAGALGAALILGAAFL